MNTKFRRAPSWLMLAVAGSAVLLSACADSGAAEQSKGTASENEACVDKANDFLASWDEFPTTLPESPPARYTQLEEAPTPGQRIVFIRQNFPALASTVEGLSTGAEALGWTAEQVIYDNTVPDFLAKLDSVIADKPDFIAWSGLPAALATRQIKEAKAAGINIVISATTDTPVSSPGLAGVGNGTETAKAIAQLHAYKMLSDSDCQGDTAIFSLDYPIIDVSDQEYQRVVKENCPDCKVSVVKIQPQDIGTPEATQQMVAKLQADPAVEYAYTVIGDLAGGLSQGLRTAGLENVNIFGQVPNENSIAELRAGTNAWWALQASYVNGLDTIDMAARVAVTGEVQADSGGYPLALLTKDNVPGGDDVPTVPSNIADLYAETWNAG